ncbi:MAG: MarR family transcriptional regulator [Chloroflexi bacterium]|nr:MarR family transcriptional regulator [Chloroflexota bacterium]
MTDTLTRAPVPLEIDLSRPGIRAWRTFLGAHAAVTRRLEAELEAEGLISLADYDVLVNLATAPGGKQRMSELADHVLLSRSGMTRRIDRLEAAGFVSRAECAADRRGSYAAITADGLERVRSAGPTHLRGIEEHFLAKLSADELDAIRAALAKVIPPGSPDGQPDC